LQVMRKEDCIAVMMNAHRFIDDPGVLQGVWNLRDSFKVGGNMLILAVTAGALMPAELANDVLVLDQPLPTPEELGAVLKDIVKATTGLDPLTEIQEQQAIAAVAGLAAFPAEQAMAMSASSKGFDLDGLWERKRQAIEAQPGLSVARGECPEPTGLENARDFLKLLLKGRKKYGAVVFIDEIEKAFAGTGTDTSGTKTGITGTFLSWTTEHKADGVMCIGVPGGGKSMLAKWAASIAGLLAIIWDIGAMQSGIVGSTEERMRSALKTIDAISNGPVLMIATCNSIGSMPPEILRRFNRSTLFFDLMGREEREACWKYYRKQLDIPANDTLPNDDGWTGSEINECCQLACQLNVPLKKAAEFIVPVCRSSADKIKTLRQFASGKYISASVPGIYQSNEQAEALTSSSVRKIGAR
jgi:hypothetical protein